MDNYTKERIFVEEQRNKHIITALEYYIELERLSDKHITDPTERLNSMLSNKKEFDAAFEKEIKERQEVVEYLKEQGFKFK